MSEVRYIASPKTWIEGEAKRQLERTAQAQDMRLAVGLPDLHPGAKGSPIGAAFITEGTIRPFLVGNDVGCGMALFATDLRRKDVKLDRFAKKLAALDEEWDARGWLTSTQSFVNTDDWENALGTIGSGNHFAELQSIEKIFDLDAVEELKLTEVVLMVHSGSRGYGEAILQSHVRKHGDEPLTENSEEANEYLEKHHHALSWARINREAIAWRFVGAIGARLPDYAPLIDIFHNEVREIEFEGKICWLHRKGAAPADQGPIVIPGSRGDFSYVVVPIGDQTRNALSLPHGAGRKWGRSDCKGRLERRYKADELKRTDLGSVVICESKSLLYEEAPQAYKNIANVVQDVVDHDLVKVIAVLRPLITFKTTHRD